MTQDAKDAKTADFIVNMKEPIPDKEIPAVGSELKLLKDGGPELDGTYDTYTQVPASATAPQARRSCSRTVSCRPQRRLRRGSRQLVVVPLQPTKSSKLTAFLERQRAACKGCPLFAWLIPLNGTLTAEWCAFESPLRSLKSWFSVVALTVCASLPAQDHSKHERTVPSPIEPKPFSTIATRQTPVYTVEFRSADELSQQDRLLIANAESSIAEHAGFAGLEYQQAGWAYNQIICPAFPNHLFLQYTRNNGSGDVTVFSASIPRNGEGRVRIVPILKRSYSLFSPAPINALTISAFNHIRAEEGESANSDWLGNALCYAALAGSQPEIVPPDTSPAVHKPIPALTAAMDVELQKNGQEVIRFDDAAAHPHAMEWSMRFTSTGKLVKATHRPAGMLAAKPVPQKSPVIRTRQVAQSTESQSAQE